jgi:hypothetical protein
MAPFGRILAVSLTNKASSFCMIFRGTVVELELGTFRAASRLAHERHAAALRCASSPSGPDRIASTAIPDLWSLIASGVAN